MTRDEADKIAQLRGYGPALVDVLDALGVLKLDEPKSVRDRFNEAWCSIPPSCRTIPNMLKAMDEAGLKIVEK